MKTIHLTNFYHAASGGIGTFYRALLRAANAAGREMVLIVPGATSGTEETEGRGRIRQVAAGTSPVFDRRYRLLSPTSYLPPFAGEVAAIIREEQPDLIEICDKYTLCWMAGAIRRGWISGIGRPALVGLSCERLDDNISAFVARHNLTTRLSRWYLGSCYLPLFDYHIANSDYTASELQEAMIARHQRPVSVLPMGAEIGEFSASVPSATFRQRLTDFADGTEATRLLLYAGRISPEKNIPLLIETMEALRQRSDIDVRLLIAGSGPLSAWLRDEAERRVPGLVRFVGHISDRQEMIACYANCDIFIHPNPREPFGIAPLEAMAAGIPLLAPNAGGVLSYADDSNAWLCEPNGQSFADGAMAILSDDAERRDRLSRARWTADNFRWSLVTKRFLDEYSRMVADGTSRLTPSQRLGKLIAHGSQAGLVTTEEGE